MDALTFITEMTKALAWPAVATVIALLARNPVAALVTGQRLQRMKGAGWEFEFGELEARVKHAIAELPPAPRLVVGAQTAALPEPGDDDAALARIVTAWNDLETPIREAANARFGMREGVPFGKVLNELARSGALKPGTVEALRGLETMRNLAVHAPGDEALAPRVPHFTALADALRWTVDSELKPAPSKRSAGNE